MVKVKKAAQTATNEVVKQFKEAYSVRGVETWGKCGGM